MSGTSLILLAMYSTVNVVGPAGANLTHLGQTAILTTLLLAVGLTLAAIVACSQPARRVVPKGPTLAKARRRYEQSGRRFA